MPKIRGAFHLHSQYSYDGRIPLAEMASFLKSKGYSFGLMSEHNYHRSEKRYLCREELSNFIRECQSLSSPEFLLIPGLEYSCCDNKVHIVVTPLADNSALEGIETPEQVIEKTRREKSLAFLVHPFFGEAYRRVSPEVFGKFDGFEVWNYNYQSRRGPSLSECGQLKQWFKRPGVLAVAGLDLHRREKFGDVWIEMEVSSLNQEAVFGNLRQGKYTLSACGRHFDSAGNLSGLWSHLTKRLAARVLNLLRIGK